MRRNTLGIQLGEAFSRLAKPVPGSGEAGPGVLGGSEPGPHGGHREPAGLKALVLHFGPAQWGGHRRASAGPHAVAGHYGLRVGVAHDVGIDAVTPLVLALLGGDDVWVPAGQDAGLPVREL